MARMGINQINCSLLITCVQDSWSACTNVTFRLLAFDNWGSILPILKR